MAESLIGQWQTHDPEPGAGLFLVDTSHAMQFYIGRTDTGRPRVVIRGDIKPQLLNLSGVVLIERFEDKLGMWNLSFTLQDAKFETVFLRLADDMHARSASAATPAVAMFRIAAVIEEWRRLLKPRPLGVLSMEELRGLIGELWLVLNWFSKDHTVDSAVHGWLGPLGLPQDFWFESAGAFEAKSIGPSTVRIRISSAEQLDLPNLQLLVVLVANTAESQPRAINLPTLVAQVQAALAEAGAGDTELHERLEHLGVEVSHPFYATTWFVVSRVTNYNVSADFPSIRKSDLPDGIESVTYQLSLDAIEEFKVGTIEVG